MNNAKRDIAYRKNPFEKASEEGMRRITHLAFNYDNMHLEFNNWLYSFIRYLVQQLRNVHVVTYFLRSSTFRSMQKNKAYISGRILSTKELRNRRRMNETEIDERSDTDLGTEIESFGDVDDDDDDDDSDFGRPSDDDSERTRCHNSFPCRSYTDIEKTSKILQRDWTWARREWWKPIWKEFFNERQELLKLDNVTLPKEKLLENPDWTLPRVQLLSFEEMGCRISLYNKHRLYQEEGFACPCESDVESEMLGSSDRKNGNSNAEDDF